MSKDPKQVRVALTGNVWYEKNLAAVISDEIMDPPTATAVNLGFTTADGVTFTVSRNVIDIDGWQSRDPLRKLVEAEPRSCAFTLRQVSRAIWLATMGGKVATLVAAVAGSAGPPVVAAKPAIYRWEPDEGKLPEGAIWVDFDDEKPDGTALRYRFGFRRAAQSEAVEFALKRTDAVNLPNNWSALAVTDGLTSFYMDTNDTEFAAA